MNEMHEPKDLRPVSRPRGRPRAEQECVSLSTWVPTTTADKLIRLAQKNDMSVSSLVRTFVVLQLNGDTK